MSAYLSGAASGSSFESMASRGSSPACQRRQSPFSSARTSISCSWGQVQPGRGQKVGQVEGRRGSKKRACGKREGVGTGAEAEPAGDCTPGWGQSRRPPLVILPDCLNLSDLMAMVQLSLQADLSVRLYICRQVGVGSGSCGGGGDATLRTHFVCQG